MLFSVVILNSILMKFCKFTFTYSWFCADSAVHREADSLQS